MTNWDPFAPVSRKPNYQTEQACVTTVLNYVIEPKRSVVTGQTAGFPHNRAHPSQCSTTCWGFRTRRALCKYLVGDLLRDQKNAPAFRAGAVLPNLNRGETMFGTKVARRRRPKR